jgi:Coenzyme PQQ synthesis protein D (PqqD)
MRIGLDDRVHINDEVVFRNVDGEAVLLHVERGFYYGLDPVGTRVWESLVAHGCARPVVESLLEDFDVTADALESDVATLLNELRANDLIVVRSS